ncbi:hypothetical protein BG003_005073 [Podila horticola]|nr:hypothetical protein BG003_005073 [Podila horticola]
MKTITFIATLCLAAVAQAQVMRPTNPVPIAPANCGFYAGVTYRDAFGRPRNCKVSIEVTRPNQGSPCVDRANKFKSLDRTAANRCSAFTNRRCHATDTMPFGQICLGDANQPYPDTVVESMFRECLSYATGQIPSYPWAIRCDNGVAPDYGRFTPRP